MELKFTRRRFGQLVFVSTAAAGLGILIERTVAQTPTGVILGVSTVVTNSDNSDSPTSDTPDEGDEAGTVSRTSPTNSVIVQSFNLASQEVKTVLQTPAFLLPGEQIDGFAALRDGSIVILAKNTATNQKPQKTARLVTLGDSPKSTNISGLKGEENAQSITRLSDGSLGVVVNDNSGTQPSRVNRINRETGEVIDSGRTIDTVPNSDKQVTDKQPIDNKPIDNSGLQRSKVEIKSTVQCPDNNFIGFTTDRSGNTSLYLVNQARAVPISFEGVRWNAGFNGLVCSPSGEIFALGARRYEYPLYLHVIDRNTGELKRLKPFDVAAITLG